MKINRLVIETVSIGVCIAAVYCIYRYTKHARGENWNNELLQHIHDSSQWADRMLKHRRNRGLEDNAEVTSSISIESLKAAEKQRQLMNAVAIE